MGVHLTDAKGKFTLPNGDSTVIEAKAGARCKHLCIPGWFFTPQGKLNQGESLKALNLTVEQLGEMQAKRGTAEFYLKKSISHTREKRTSTNCA